MQVTETLNEGLKREYTVVISAGDIDEKMTARLEELGRTIRVPGFRPGKVPPSILKQRYGASVMGEVLEQSLTDSSQQAIAERGLRPAMQPKIEVTSYDEGKDLEYKIAIELLPEIEPMDFSALELERLKVDIPDSEVEAAIERIGAQQRATKPLETPRKSESGDVLVIDFKGTVDGEAFPGMDGSDHHLELGSNSFIAGFEDQLVGLDKGAETKVTVTFPEEYVNDKLAGREAVFEVTVKDILEAQPAVIDEDFAKSLGMDSLEALTEQVRSTLSREYDQIARSRLKRDLLDRLAESHQFEVPEGMVEAEFDTIWQQVQADREAGREDPDDAGKDEETLKGEYRDIAGRRVRLGLLLSEVGRLNSIEVSNDELNRALFQEASRHQGQEQQVVEFYQQNPQALANLRGPLFEEKVVDFIVDLAKVSDRSMAPEEFRTLIESETSGGAAEAEDEKAAPAKKPAKKAAAKKSAKKAPAKKAPAKKAAKKAADKTEDGSQA